MKQLVVQSNVFTTANQKIIWTFYRDLVVIMGRGFKISKVHGLMNGGAKHAASVLEVDIKDRGLLVEIALNHNSPLDVLLVHCWKPP